jgi:hypothetical protein
MRGWEGSTPRGAYLVAALAMTLAPGMDGASAEATATTAVRLQRAEERIAVVQAIRGAAHRLDDPRCQALLTSFTDAAERSLREVLDAQGLSASDYLSRIFFYDGSASDCRQRRLAYTAAGSRVVFVCADRFRKVSQQSPAYAEGAIIHEALHTLGFGENPPTWEEITARVLDACRH